MIERIKIIINPEDKQIDEMSSNEMIELLIKLNKCLRCLDSEEVRSDGMIAGDMVAPTREVQDKVLASNTRYFLITKNPLDMKTILVDWGFKPSDVNEVIVGPGNDRPGAIKLGDNQSFTQEEGDAFEAMADKGYKIHFALLPDKQIGYWDKFKGKFGY